jgi:DNA polymerase-3 subunit epsilon
MVAIAAFLDLETTGLSPSCSVLSASSVLVEVSTTGELTKNGVFNRYYYPEEGTNRAVQINGLSFEEISKHRDKATYPGYFKDDAESFRNFLGAAGLFIAHNLRFDASFLPFKLSPGLCTMRFHNDLTRINGNRRFGPSLERLARHYGVKLDLSRRHTSLYDVELLVCIFERMLTLRETKSRLRQAFQGAFGQTFQDAFGP